MFIEPPSFLGLEAGTGPPLNEIQKLRLRE